MSESKIALGDYGDPLVPNGRLERIFYQLQRNFKFPDGLRFATQLQEPIKKDNFEQGPRAVFFVISPHPRQHKNAMSPEELVSIGQMPYSRWKDAEAQQRHYAGLSDPLRPVFAVLLKQHLDYRKSYEELD